ncbi:Putative Dihydroneopterin aldolase domain protein [Aspergillus calidoustus]|uniref:dihydroneopterin aldolase n=1 Tax=Aspergillus calidoustus TaxID=454130 RepID=A0A0U5GAG8_ASPCI|nr:Putative Dihydroneopterin aldolase domain protein [Aspergillus calidoustus]
MAEQRVNVHIPSRPAVLDSVRLRNIQLPLPAAPDPWHRTGKPQPCTASLSLSYSSAVAAADADDVSLSLDYGKLYRRLEEDVRHMGKPTEPTPVHHMISMDGSRREEMLGADVGQDVRLTAGIVANCGLGLLDETAAGIRRMAHVQQNRRRSSASASEARAAILNNSTSAPVSSGTPIDDVFGQCEVWLHLPKALLRAESGLHYRSVTVWGYRQGTAGGDATSSSRCPVVLEEEFRIEGIRCYCILGVNSHERVEKQAVIISLEFKGPGQLAWGSTVVDTYQAMTRAVAERVEETSFQTVEALATFVARIATVDFANERVKVRVEKPSALAFVERSGVEVTRSQAFFERSA